MSIYAFAEYVDTTIDGFNTSTDTLAFAPGYSARNLILTAADGGGTRVIHGGASLTLAGVAPADFDGHEFTFDDGSLFRQGTAGADTLSGGTLADRIDASAGGDDAVAAGDGNDLLQMGAALSSGDSVQGGLGNADELHVAGEYATAVALQATTVQGVERFVFGGGGTVRIQLHQAVFDSTDGHVTFDASAQGGADGLWLDGSQVSAMVDALGGAGSDTLLGGAGHDSLSGGIGADSLGGGSGADTLVGGLDADTLTGGSGNDRFVFQPGTPRGDAAPDAADRITDFATGDLIDLPGTFSGRSVVFNTVALAFDYTGDQSGQQDDVNENDGFVDVYWRNNIAASRLEIWVDSDDDGLFGESDLLIHLDNGAGGKTSVMYADFVDNFVAWRGTAGDDDYVGNASNNTAFALAGEDTLAGGFGADLLYGGTGDDEVSGDEGDDTLHGGSGADTLHGGAGSDSLYAVGMDGPSSYATDDPLRGNALYGDAGTDYLQGSGGGDVLDGGDDGDHLSGEAGNDTLRGGAGNDTLFAGDGSDLLQGGEGNDALSSGGGDVRDTLEGGAGNDTLYGIGGQVTLAGGAGADRFAFHSAESDEGSFYSDMVRDARYSTVSAPGTIADFDQAEGDLIRSGVRDGTSLGSSIVW
ncbi:MAG TPA: calcium-binding protein, partial [Ramlibacter sp.]